MKKFVLMICLFTASGAVGNAQTFSKAECIKQWTKDVDRPFRLSAAKATARCNAVERRINLLSKQILGKWQARIEGRTSTLQFFADGTALQDGVRKTWAIKSTGNVDDARLEFDEFGPASPIKIIGNVMTLVWISDGSLEHVARWKRVR